MNLPYSLSESDLGLRRDLWSRSSHREDEKGGVDGAPPLRFLGGSLRLPRRLGPKASEAWDCYPRNNSLCLEKLTTTPVSTGFGRGREYTDENP